jgi:hypothetical protein
MVDSNRTGRGEQTASYIEASLTALERKLDAILAAHEPATTQNRGAGSEQAVEDRESPDETDGSLDLAKGTGEKST